MTPCCQRFSSNGRTRTKLPFLPIFLKRSRDERANSPDWKKHCEELQAAYDKLNAMYDSFRKMYDEHVADWKDAVENKSEQIEAAHLQIAELNQVCAGRH